MTREEAVSTLRNTAWLGSNDDRNNVEEAIEILTTDKGGEIIYRQDAIDAVKSLPRWIMDANGEFQPVDPPTVSMLDPEDAVSAIENLLPAQSDLIYCKDCEYLDVQGTYGQCGKGILGIVNRDDFCSRAERREDG